MPEKPSDIILFLLGGVCGFLVIGPVIGTVRYLITSEPPTAEIIAPTLDEAIAYLESARSWADDPRTIAEIELAEQKYQQAIDALTETGSPVAEELLAEVEAEYAAFLVEAEGDRSF